MPCNSTSSSLRESPGLEWVRRVMVVDMLTEIVSRLVADGLDEREAIDLVERVLAEAKGGARA